MKNPDIENSAGNASFRIVFYYLLLMFILWTAIHISSDYLAKLIPNIWSNSIQIFLELTMILISGIVAFFVVNRIIAKRMETDDINNFIFNENPNAILIFDKKNFKIIQSNEEASLLFSATSHYLESTKLTELVYSQQRNLFINNFYSYTDEGFIIREVRMTKKAGKIFIVTFILSVSKTEMYL